MNNEIKSSKEIENEDSMNVREMESKSAQKKHTQKRNRCLSIWCNEEEYQRIKDQAEELHLSMSALCRKLIFEKIPKILYRNPEDVEMLNQVCYEFHSVWEEILEVRRQLRLTGQLTEEMELKMAEALNAIGAIARRLEKGTFYSKTEGEDRYKDQHNINKG